MDLSWSETGTSTMTRLRRQGLPPQPLWPSPRPPLSDAGFRSSWMCIDEEERLKERAGSCWMMKMVLSMRTTGSVQPAHGGCHPVREVGIEEYDTKEMAKPEPAARGCGFGEPGTAGTRPPSILRPSTVPAPMARSTAATRTRASTSTLIAKEKRRGKQLFQQHKLQAQAEDDSSSTLAAGGNSNGQHQYANSWPVEVAVLSQRFFKNVARTRQLFACRTVCMLVAGLALGSIFYDLAEDKVAERVGLFAFLLTFLLSSTTEALPVFLQEREILAKETSSGAYRVSAYAVANALVFLPFQLVLAAVFAAPAYWLTGLRRTAPAFFYFLLLIWLVLYTANSVVACFAAAAPDFVVGNAAVQGVMGSFFLFSGYFIRRSAMPAYWVPMHYLSLFKWPFEALLLNEFGGKCAARAMGVCVATGDEVLRREGIGEECRWRNVAVMVGFVAFYRVLGYAVLRVRCSLTLRAAARSALLSSSSHYSACFSASTSTKA
ncbi:ABC transporter G family member 5 [Triticum urartu]|uniref:ABC transporter G family member 5 n=1 Tax=Triticum urartu TaxID=4572 RepID=M7ZRT0_TRIUA|nr:ABC transporter G family member 5 [Triticum urartu]